MGPITTRQFVIMLFTAMVMFVEYKAADFTLFLLESILTFAFGGTLAFFRVNGQPFHFFLLNLVQTLRKPRTRVWDKELNTDELRRIIVEPPPPPPPKKVVKTAVASTRLSELSLVVNTGGVYNPEE